MIIYFVRHGESLGNKGGTYQTLDTPLSKEGVSQAKKVGKRLTGIHFDLIYSSDAVRTRQTIEFINQSLDAEKIEYWEELREIRTPTEVQNKNHESPEVKKIMDNVLDNFKKNTGSYSDEESFNELNLRAKKVIDHLEIKHKDQTILVVSHAAFIKTMVGRLIFGDELTGAILLQMRFHMDLQNTGVTICQKHPRWGWQLNTWSDMSHL